MHTLFKLLVISSIYILIPVQSQLLAESITVKIEGMSCQACADSIAGALQEKDTVKNVQVSFDTKSATIELAKDAELKKPELTKIIEELGYKISSLKRENK